MKRALIFGILLVVLFLVSPVVALKSNMQDWQSMNDSIGFTTNSLGGYWKPPSTTGGNNYYYIVANGNQWVEAHFPKSGIVESSTYAAFDGSNIQWPSSYPHLYLRLINSAGAIITQYDAYTSSGQVGRWEIKVAGGKAYWFLNGVQKANATATTNPYQIQIYSTATSASSCNIDNIVFSSTDSQYVFGLAESDEDEFIIMDDIVNPANNGIFNTTTGVLASSTMIGTWSRGSGSAIQMPQLDPLPNETITLVHYTTGEVYGTNYTGTAYYGTVSYNVQSLLIDTGAPDGYYALTIPGSGAYSNLLLKRSAGATVVFDANTYAIGDKATVSYEVTNTYWLSDTYTYVVKIVDIYGQTKASATLSERTGTLEYLFASGDVSGVYYAAIEATPTAGGSSVWMGTDYATVTEYGKLAGYVTDQNGVGISGAHLNFSQTTLTTNTTSGIDGNYTTASFFITGSELLCDVTATGYRQHYYNILPYSTTTKHINFTLPSSSLSYLGLGIDGIAMEGYLDGLTIRNGYGTTISGVAVNITNVSTGQNYTKYTNSAGWYLCDEGSECHLSQNVPYAIEGMKVGYENSSIYTKIASGVL